MSPWYLNIYLDKFLGTKWIFFFLKDLTAISYRSTTYKIYELDV